ncbi:hypothetical protein RYX36_008525 [Vicia faba]
MAEENDAFYVVKKGNLVGIYKSLSDIQHLLSSSVCGESVGVYKGFCLPEETEEYLVSHGLKGAAYSISAANVNAASFGKLVPCPYQDPYSSGGGAVTVNSSSRSLQGALQVDDSNPNSNRGKTIMANSSSQAMQLNANIQGLWKVKNENMSYLCNEAKEHKNKFMSFKINHIPREYNRDADTQANRAVNLKDGEVEEECEMK